MRWRLILTLSLFGVAMGVASVLGFTGRLEPLFWLIIGIFCAVVIGRTPARHFRHGFMVGLLAGAFAPLIQALLFESYAANSPEITESFKQIPGGLSARTFILLTMPVISLLSGVVLGLLALVAGRLLTRKSGEVNPA